MRIFFWPAGPEKNSGQMLIIMGLGIALGLVAAAVFLNEIALTGFLTTQSELTFPKSAIRDFRLQAVAAVKSAASRSAYDPATFTSIMTNASTQLGKLAALQGAYLELRTDPVVLPGQSTFSSVTLTVIYDDSGVLYESTEAVAV